jgi:hypothetical protein
MAIDKHGESNPHRALGTHGTQLEAPRGKNLGEPLEAKAFTSPKRQASPGWSRIYGNRGNNPLRSAWGHKYTNGV